MKKLGIILLIVGCLLTAFAGFNFYTKKKIVDIGELEISTKQKHSVNWSPYAGVALMLLGGGAFLYGYKQK